MSAIKVPHEDWAEITRLYCEKGVSQHEIAAKYGCASSRISQIITAYNSDPDSPDYPHGSKAGYEYGCRCHECRVARRKASRETHRRQGLFQNRRAWISDDQ